MPKRHTWIYASKKADLVTFLLRYEPKAIYEFMQTANLRKLIQRIYAETQVKEDTGGKNSTEQKSQETQSTSTGASAEKQIEIETTSETKNIKNLNIKDILPEEICDIISKHSDVMEGENWIFNPKKEDWDSCIERLELQMEMKNKADNKN